MDGLHFGDNARVACAGIANGTRLRGDPAHGVVAIVS